MSDQTNQSLDDYIAQVQQGDGDAFRPVVEEMLASVRAFIAGRSMPGVDVDEIVQRTFVEAYQAIATYKVGTNFRAWLMTIARYQLMMESTRLQRLTDYHSRYVPTAIAKELENNLQTEGDEDERLEHLRECLNQISDSGKQLLQQRYEGDHPIKEIADSLDRTAGAVRKQLCLLRQQLHDCVSSKLALEQHHDF